MGGEVLELLNDRAERLEREAESRGLEQGIKRGIEQGIEQGMEQGIAQGVERGASDLAELLKDLGVGKEVIDEAMQTLRDKRKQEASVEEE